MAPKRRRDAKPVHIVVEHFPAPDAAARLRRAVDLVLRATDQAEGVEGREGDRSGKPLHPGTAQEDKG